MKIAPVYLVVDGCSAWPITQRYLADWYRRKIFVWPDCEIVEQLGADWSMTKNGNFVREKGHQIN